MKKTVYSILFIFGILVFESCSSLEEEDSIAIKNEKLDTHDSKIICPDSDDPFNYNNILYSKRIEVDYFKDTFTVSVKVTKCHFGNSTFNDTVNYVESFTHETSLIQLSDSVAVKWRIGRVIMDEKKCYIQNFDFYRKEKNCWSNVSQYEEWSPVNIGDIASKSFSSSRTWSSSTGESTNEVSIGYEGEITLE